jgi:hypothetical protein
MLCKTSYLIQKFQVLLQIAGEGPITLGADSSEDKDVGKEEHVLSSQRKREACDENFQGASEPLSVTSKSVASS